MKLIFIFSLPRSGSTLLQRLIASHPQISTTSEEDKTTYFLDKTPRYHLVINEIYKLFPESKKIFLWRNPLSVVTSIMNTWGQGKWNLYRYKIDLFQGLNSLIEAYQASSNEVASICFESLLVNPEDELDKIFSYLDLDFDSNSIASFHELKLKGRTGDQVGVHEYQSISQEPLEKWKNGIVNPVRKLWCRHYLKGIGREKLEIMGYDLDDLLVQIDSLPLGVSLTLSDVGRIMYGSAYCLLDPDLTKRKLKEASSWRKIVPYS